MDRDKTHDAADLLNVLVMGVPTGRDEINDDTVDVAIDICKELAVNNPQLMLRHIGDAVQCRLDGMTRIALAILTARADVSFFTRKNVGLIQAMLLVYGPPELVEYIELLKSKAFGRGFGSRPQKWVRSIVESWNPPTIANYSTKHPVAFYSLIRLVHPRFRGGRGDQIRAFLASRKE